METFENDKIRKHHFGKEHCHSRRNHHLLGIVLVIVGGALILKNMGFVPDCVKNIIFSWQMLLVVIGVVTTLASGEKTNGVVVMAIGAFFLIPKIFRETFDINIFWPAIFIVVGIILICSKRLRIKGGKGRSEAKIGDNFIDIVNIFSGSDKRITSDNFSGGRITSIFGGNEIDLTQSKLAEGVSILEVTCVFGGTTISVPYDWNVKSEVLPVLGGFDDDKASPNKLIDTSKQLIIKGVIVFGGGEIKRY